MVNIADENGTVRAHSRAWAFTVKVGRSTKSIIVSGKSEADALYWAKKWAGTNAVVTPESA